MVDIYTLKHVIQEISRKMHITLIQQTAKSVAIFAKKRKKSRHFRQLLMRSLDISSRY